LTELDAALVVLLVVWASWSAVVYYELRAIRRKQRLILAFFRSHSHEPNGDLRLDSGAVTFPDSNGQIRPAHLR